jgi:hypothetical protein
MCRSVFFTDEDESFEIGNRYEGRTLSSDNYLNSIFLRELVDLRLTHCWAKGCKWASGSSIIRTKPSTLHLAGLRKGLPNARLVPRAYRAVTTGNRRPHASRKKCAPFSDASWERLNNLRPRFAEILSIGTADPKARYADFAEQAGGLLLACTLNLLSAMSQIILPSNKTPIDYYWQPIWEEKNFPMAQDRFFAYVDKALVDDIVEAGKRGMFAQEPNPGAFYPGATISYEQTQFDVTNVQLTFHQGEKQTIQTPNGSIECVMVEPDIDFYKDLLAHFFMEVLPNEFTKGKTDPRAVYTLRWMAGKQAARDFDPLYTIVTYRLCIRGPGFWCRE